jgi:arylsulfatase A-like enzyme
MVPTLLELTGGTKLADAPLAPGKSLVPVFSEDGTVQHDLMWWFHDDHKAIRMGDWKAVAPVGEPWELYNLASDRGESANLATVEATKLMELVAEWDRQLAAMTKLASRDLAK